MIYSLNLTDPKFTRAMSAEEAAHFDAPLFISAGLIVVEVVFLSSITHEWIHLVGGRTARVFPAGYREVAAAELADADRTILGV